MGGYNANPPPDSDAPPATAALADAGNVVGRENRAKYGLPGYGGRSDTELDATLTDNQQKQQIQQQQQSRQPGMKYQGWEQDAGAGQQQTSDEMGRQRAIIDSIQSRPRYMDIGSFGDSTTQASLAALPANADKSAELGRILEEQRKRAELTPGKTDDRYFENQLSLWNAQNIERAGGYSSWASNTGKQQFANPFENVADIALSWEKAGNVKDNFGKNYAFNPNVGTLLSKLPTDKNGQPMGLQEYDWSVAKANEKGSGQPGSVDWMPAINYVNSQRGKYGVYGSLYGGKPDPIIPTPSVTANRNAMVTPLDAVPGAAGVFFTGMIEPAPKVVKTDSEIIQPTGEIDVFGNKLVIPGLAFFQQPTTKTTNTFTPRTEVTPFATAFGDNFKFKAAADINKLDASPWVSSRGDVAVGSALLSAPVAVGLPVITTRFNPDTGVMETISEQKYNQESTQKYETWDMTKQKVTPTVTSFTVGKSGLDKLNDYVSDKYIKPYTPTPEEATRSGYAFLHVGKLVEGKGRVITDTDIASFEKNAPYGSAGVKFFTEGFYGGIRDKPVTAGVSLGVGAGMGAIFRGAGMLTPAIERVAGPTVTRALTFTGGKVIPIAMTGLYGAEVAGRSTEGFTNYNPTFVSKNLGAITSTEIMPAIAGFNAAYGFGRSTPTPGQERTTFFQQEPIRYPRGYGRGTEVRSNILMAQELQMKPEVKSLDLTNLIPEVNLDTGRYSGFKRPENIATPAEQAMIMRQFQLTPQEIRMAKTQGLSLNDIMGIRTLETPMMTAEVQPVQVYRVQQMFSQEPLTLSMLETPQTKQVSGLYGNQQLIGNNLVRSLVRTQEQVNYQDVIPAVITTRYGMVGTTPIIGSNVIQQLGRKQVSKQEQLPAVVSLTGTVVTPKQDTRSRQAIMPNLMTGVIQLPSSMTRTTPISTPKNITTNEPGWARTITQIVPIIPVLPSFPGMGEGGRPRRGRRNRNVFNMGLDIAARTSLPRMPRVIIPKIPGGKKRRKR